MAAVKEKRVEDSMIEQVHKLRPTHMNGMGRLFADSSCPGSMRWRAWSATDIHRRM